MDTIPILIQNCPKLGLFPRFSVDIDWVPVDTVAQFVVSNLNLNKSLPKLEVFNLVNPG
jgi:hypothetical protein